MKRLFCVTEPNGRQYIPTDVFKELYDQGKMTVMGFFEDKTTAKVVRDALNAGVSAGLKKYTVSRGPDHIGKHGHKVARMRRQPKPNQE